jgi:hypothetical protein
MKVRSLCESTDRYVKGCVRAYLEGSHDLRWIISIVGTSTSGITRAELALARLGTYGDSVRRGELLEYIARCRRNEANRAEFKSIVEME